LRYRGRVLANANASNGVGKFTGAETHTLTIPQMPKHNHTGTTGNGLASGTVPYTTDEGGNANNNVVLSGNTTINSSILAHTHTVSIDDTGAGASHNNMQPTEFVYFHIKY